MKIMLVSPNTLRHNTAGIEQAVFFLAKYLQKKKYDVEIYCTAANPQGKIQYQGLTLHEFPRISPHNAYFFSPQLYAAIRKSHHDIIHAYGYNNTATMAALAAKKPTQKFILTGASSISSSKFRKLLHPLLNLYYRMLGKKMDKVICVSPYESELLHGALQLPEHKYVQIPNGIEVEELMQRKKHVQKYMILTVARLVRQKGVHRLIAALPEVLKKYPKAQLHVVGDGAEKISLQTQAKELGVQESVVFHGHIQFDDKEKLLDLFARAHVFSLMADSESQGLVYGMAIAMRTHVLATNSSAMKDLISAGAAVGIDDPDDAHAIAKALMQQFESPAPKVDVEKLIWSWGRVGAAVEKVYSSLISKQ